MSAKRKPVPVERLKTPRYGHETLERLKRWPQLAEKLRDRYVMIWSGEHRGYWREGGCGYVDSIGIKAGIANAETLTIEAALAKTRHCGPEKQIEFHSLF